MLIVMDAHATPDAVDRVCEEIRAMGYVPHPMPGPTRTAIGVTGNEGAIVQTARIKTLPGVSDVVRITKPYKLVSRDFKEADTVVQVGGVEIGGAGVVVMAGPCTIESRDQLFATAQDVIAQGATVVRGGAYKPRTSPYSFGGLGEEGLRYLAEVREELGAPVVTEVMDKATLPLVEQYADIVQIGARNMQNYPLLRAVGRSQRPVLLKRGFASTVNDLLLAAEYVLAEGNKQVILCERGIRTFDDHSRFTLDLGAIPVLKQLTHLPVIVDPSHAAGKRELIPDLARAAIACGADGLIIECHPVPEQSVSDARQALSLEGMTELVQSLVPVATAIGRRLSNTNQKQPAQLIAL